MNLLRGVATTCFALCLSQVSAQQSGAVSGGNKENGAEQVMTKIKNDLVQNTTFGGYIIGKASASDQDLSASTTSHTNFDLRLVRLYVDGKVMDFQYKLQMEVNGVGSSATEKGPRIVDAWAEWQRYRFAKVKFGQFKRAFTFENPMNPWDIGFGAYSQLIDKLAGMNDRVGEHACNGRDLGVQVQGDFLPAKGDGHNLLHYQVGVYNGQGINHSDANNSKDIIGGISVLPLKNLEIGVFGWSGDYTKNGITVDRNRMACGLKYEGKWSVRAEYAVSEGHKVSDYSVDEQGNTVVSGSDKADAWYIGVGAPVTDKLKLYAKWDVYRDTKAWSSQKSIYALSANYYFCKNLKLQANYSYTRDKVTVADGRYNTFDMQLYVRF
ncbi:MAG: OprO/OprP family phosphate-selective porin [Bacteroides sp.]|nr:OprO/OprP family phosphate-selective porin [Roseburia sp.]MCM1347152.1 OprO/OprP family phosphate-selective porin [Bacteroides sp.]MCM1421003.1 OprO/OprP family phosphate-selective porin [Bacteroides sp.]